MRRRQLYLSLIVVTTLWAGPSVANNEPSMPATMEERATTFLKSLPREWSGSSAHDCRTYEDKNVDKLATSFAEAAAAFLDAFRNLHGPITITSAHRTPQEQTCVCIGEKGPCAGRPRVVVTKSGRRVAVRGTSRHQLGIALDVRPGSGSQSDFACLHEFARLNPHFGVHFPLGSRDYPHMELRPSTAQRNPSTVQQAREVASCPMANS